MSHRLCGIVRRKDCGSMIRKAVLGALADRAGDDGREIFARVETYAALAGCHERPARSTLRELERDGLIRRVGKRPGRRGATFIYEIDLAALEALPDCLPDRRNPAPREPPKPCTPYTPYPAPGAGFAPIPGSWSPPYPAPGAAEPSLRTKEASAYASGRRRRLPNAEADASGGILTASTACPPDQNDCGVAKAIQALTEGFADVLSPKLTAEEWEADIAELEAHGADFDSDILPGAHAFFRLHRRRAKRDATWAPLRRPLRHPIVRRNILAGVDDRSGESFHDDPRTFAAEAPEAAPPLERFDIKPDTPEDAVWGKLKPKRRRATAAEKQVNRFYDAFGPKARKH